MTEISSMLITHTKASIVEMESAWHGGIDQLLLRLKSHELVEECAVLKTCNRVEVYVVSPKGSKVLLDFAKHMKVSSWNLCHLCQTMEGSMTALRSRTVCLPQSRTGYARLRHCSA